ncbi:DUF5312 family protein [Leadbettera azotonutricia]|uniref:Uncharacterized protein n=1 Tax=Leadbettera azotonutricia (strain ATCC BAA-888 / DSM 13862 / ZAS-9) TaxID=545695 RepID=F5YFC1_LEAAZ|nr:DUF5312 family protein [Leadbettera azotonutricia]AEF81466.1 hypothetical protein TREAZ_1384 [Leadbettera azotonutricia ZAS-9]
MADVLNKVISFISGDGESGGSDKQVLLKQLAKDIQQNKYTRFYKVRQEEADPSFAQYMYSVYKILYPAKVFINDPAKDKQVRHVTIESFLDKSTMDVIKRLTPEAIAERKKATAGPELTKQLEADLAALTLGFDSPRLTAADKCYTLIGVLNRFASYDYPALLKKFDAEIIEGDFTEQPKFSALRTDTIMADIAKFLSVLPSFDPQDDWKTVFEILKYCNGGTDVIPHEIWTGLLVNLKDLKASKMLDLMIKLASGNPIWEFKGTPADGDEDHLSAHWLDQKTAEVRQVISDIADRQKNAQIAALEKAVFGEIDTTRLNFYNKESGKILVQKDLEAYTMAPALNHLMVFIQDFLNKEIQELSEILLVRGQWTNNAASIAMSDGYHTVRDIEPEINTLDETLSEDGSNGPRLHAALLRVDRDPSQAHYLESIVGTINEEALSLVNRAVQGLIIVGKHLKMLLEDYNKKPFELIINWKELTLASKTPLAQRLADDYKKINYFVQLMILETKVENSI